MSTAPNLHEAVLAFDGYEQLSERMHRQGQGYWYSGKKASVRLHQLLRRTSLHRWSQHATTLDPPLDNTRA